MPEEEKKDSRTLEYYLAKATDPYLEESERPGNVQKFCDQVNDELEGPQIACRLLAHKIQSPNEKEALNGLEVLDSCVHNCGQRFHNEVGKFKFLNEIIRILSPKYLGAQSSERVKQRAIELMYTWKQSLRYLPKIKQSYDMLKEQEIVTQDPTYMDEIVEPAQEPKAQMATFEDEEKSKLLATLLKSKNPEDLQAANRLIKSMVKAEDQKVERVTKRGEQLQSATNNARLLSEMIAQFSATASTGQDAEIMKELADSLQSLRSTLFRYASEAAEGDETALAEVLGTNDDVNRAMEEYKSRVEPYLSNVLSQANSQPKVTSPQPSTSQLLSLLNFDANPSTNNCPSVLETDLLSNIPPSSSGFSVQSDDVSLIGSTSPAPARSSNNAMESLNDIFGSGNRDRSHFDKHKLSLEANSNAVQNLLDAPSPVAGTAAKQREDEQKVRAGLVDLDVLSQCLIQQNLPTGTQPIVQTQKQRQKIPMREMTQTTNSIVSPSQLVDSLASIDVNSSPKTPEKSSIVVKSMSDVLVDVASGESSSEPSNPEKSETEPESPTAIDDIWVPLDKIQPGTRPPMVILDRQQLKIVLHFTANKPRDDVIVLVTSITSTNTQQFTDIEFDVKLTQQGALLKMDKPTGNTLPGFNPIFPQQAITQILLLATNDDFGQKLALDYTLGYCQCQSDNKISSHSVSGSFEIPLIH